MMRLRVHAAIAFPPGGYRLYAWFDDDKATNTPASILPNFEWQSCGRGWMAWLPEHPASQPPDLVTEAIERYQTPPQPWAVRSQSWRWGKRTIVMGVLNVTPDSFSDGGLYDTRDRALQQARHLIAAGADLIDIGGESSRPGSAPVDIEEELRRIVPTIAAIRAESDIPISVDTTKAGVLEKAVTAGADILNDISAGRFDPEMLLVAARLNVPVMLMHLKGTPRTMQRSPTYRDVIDDIYAHLEERIEAAARCGISRKNIAIDPGIGFGKTLEHNLSLLANCTQFRSLGCPIVIGASRKSFIGTILDRPSPQERLWGTGAACSIAIANGADCIRVHDLNQMKDICAIADAIVRPPDFHSKC
ncbi:MAG: dihydropteroate synthase [Cyanobacteria bacterium P01_D01_bin.123]